MNIDLVSPSPEAKTGTRGRRRSAVRRASRRGAAGARRRGGGGGGQGARIAVLLFGLTAAACASSPGPRSSVALGAGGGGDGAEAWALLAAGDDRGAETLLAARLAEAPADALARLADASLAYERGDGARAIESYAALLEIASAAGAGSPDRAATRSGAAPASGGPAGDLAAVDAGRLATLLDEHPGPEEARRTVEDRVLRVAPDALSWSARYALAVLDDRITARRGDAAAMAAAAQRNGCLRAFSVTSPVGRLPHLDLDGAAAPGPVARTVRTTGCRAAIPSFEGRAGAQRIFADVDVKSPGPFDVVLEFGGEARLIADGGPARRHGQEHLYGPRVSAGRVDWRAGRHRLEVRLATHGGRAELSLLVVPAAANPASARPTVAAAPSSGTPANIYIEGYVANQLGDLPRAQAAARALTATPRLAIGAALAAALARDDPSEPPGFARERARVLLRSAVAIDARLARVRNALAALALDDDRPHEALDEARQAATAAPGWWLPQLTLHGAYRLRGLEWDADRALDRALAVGGGACSVIQAALGRAETRRQAEAVQRFEDAAIVCGRVSDDRIERLRRRGKLAEAEALLRLAITLEPDPVGWKRELARLVLARGRAREAADLLEADLEPTDGEAVAEWADALIAAGEAPRARARVAALLEQRPDLPQILRVARALGLPLPLDAYRLDGRQVIRDFEQSKRKYAAPAVVLLDRSVTRVLATGVEVTLTHEIVRVQSKDAIEKWGEISIPEGAEILTLRTHKPDGTTREPEEVSGKDAISAADLAIGDTVEKETLEVRPPQQAFEGRGVGGRAGFLSDRFFFQSFDAPLDRSEYLLVTGADAAATMSIDARAGAPVAVRTAVADQHLVVTTFAARQVPQLFGERSSVPAIDYVPSVRVSSGASWGAWTRFLREQVYGIARNAGALDRAEAEVRAQAGRGGAAAAPPSPEALAGALVAWVGENVEPTDELRGPATFAVSSGRGNRVAAVLALTRRLGLRAQLALGRSRFTAEGAVATPIEEADDFAEILVRLVFPDGHVAYVDPRLKHAPLGYVSPGLDGARALVLDSDRKDGGFELVRSAGEDARVVELSARVTEDGRAQVQALEVVRGWPALEWSEVIDRVGGDDTKMRQDFEQRWLGVHFPGAELKDLHVEITSRPTADSPGKPYAATEVRVRYAFTSARFATADAGGGLRIAPLFFRAQPGRRYATEPRRTTSLLTSFDVATTVHARIELPPGARLAAVEPDTDRLVTRRGQYRFRERRRLDGGVSGRGPILTLDREARLSILRVPPTGYPTVAEDLRRVDAFEREDISIILGRAEGAAR